MDVTLQNRIAEKYSFMHRENSKCQDPYSVYGNFGCMIKDGWYRILDELCAEIWTTCAKEGLTSCLVVDEICISSASKGQHVTELSTETEQYHELAFRYHLNAAREGTSDAVKEKAALEKSREVRERVDAAIERQCVRSRTTCEVCGRQGKLCKRGKEIVVWCEDCFHNC